jgi:orotate phosphoribosyltransferase
MYPLQFFKPKNMIVSFADEVAAARKSVSDFICDTDEALRVANVVVQTGTFRVNMKAPRSEWYIWRSGIAAPCYCDCRRLCGYPKERTHVSLALAKSVRRTFPTVDLIVGVGTAGISWAEAVASELRLPLAYIRTKRKEHGVSGLVECSPKRSQAAVVIDDLIASGGSVQRACDALFSETGISIIGVQSIVNWGFVDMRKNLARVRFCALTSFPQILTCALSRSLISEREFLELVGFFQNSFSYDWNPIESHPKVEKHENVALA